MCVRQVLGLVLLLAAQALGQQLPFTAMQTNTRDVTSPDGRVISHVRSEEGYFFASSGSILIQDLTSQKVPIRAQLIDYGRSGKAYIIDYVGEDATEQRTLGPQPRRPNSRADVKNGNTVHVVRELSDIRVGAEPDPSLFATDPRSIRRARNLAK
jgi:hypothetical protein